MPTAYFTVNNYLPKQYLEYPDEFSISKFTSWRDITCADYELHRCDRFRIATDTILKDVIQDPESCISILSNFEFITNKVDYNKLELEINDVIIAVTTIDQQEIWYVAKRIPKPNQLFEQALNNSPSYDESQSTKSGIVNISTDITTIVDGIKIIDREKVFRFIADMSAYLDRTMIELVIMASTEFNLDANKISKIFNIDTLRVTQILESSKTE